MRAISLPCLRVLPCLSGSSCLSGLSCLSGSRTPVSARLSHPEVFRRSLAPIFLFFVAHLVTLVERIQPGLLHSRDMHKDIFASVIRLNKPKTLCWVEPLHSPDCHVCSPSNRCLSDGASGARSCSNS